MEICLLDKNSKAEVNGFIKARNQSFYDREVDKSLFDPITQETLMKALTFQDANVIVIKDDREIVGGALIERKGKGIKILYLSMLCVIKEYQGQGLAKKILQFAYDYAKQNEYCILKLSVDDRFKNAINLYKKAGFKKLSIFCSVVRRSKGIVFIKNVEPYKFPEIKRLKKLFLSKIKYFLLFNHKNSPTLLYKMIFRSKTSSKHKTQK